VNSSGQAVIATRQLDAFVNGIIKKEERTKATYLEVERHARGGWLLRWAETNLLTDAVCIYDAEVDEQNLGQSLIDTVVQKTAHRSQRRQPKQAAAAAAATTTVLATNDEVMNVGQDMHDPVRVTNVVAAAAAATTKSEKNRKTDSNSTAAAAAAAAADQRLGDGFRAVFWSRVHHTTPTPPSPPSNLSTTASPPSFARIIATGDTISKFAAPCARQHTAASRKNRFCPVARPATAGQHQPVGTSGHLRPTIGGKSIKDSPSQK
jgi:hypothetical protein